MQENNKLKTNVSYETNDKRQITWYRLGTGMLSYSIITNNKNQIRHKVPVDSVDTLTSVIDTLALKDQNDVLIHMAGTMKNNIVQRN